MKGIRWDERKNSRLLRARGVCFEQVVLLFERGAILDIYEHPNHAKYPDQRIAVVELNGYAYLVPYAEGDREILLKTIIPSRKATLKYLGGHRED